MNRRSLSVLFTLNMVLLAVLAMITLTSEPAAAQFGLRGDYTMIAGEVTGREQAAVYILDLKTQRMASVLFDSRNNRLQVVAGRDVSNDLRVRHGR